MKNNRRLLAAFTAIILLFSCFSGLIFSACGKNYGSADFFAFNSPVQVQVEGQISDQTKADIKTLLDGLEKEFSLSDKNSFTTTFNNAKKDEIINYSANARELLELCLNAYNLTEKKFNPSVLPLVELWQFYPDYPSANFAPPSQTEIDGILNSGALSLDNLTVTDAGAIKSNDGLRLDFGGILKGFAADKVAKILKNNGHDKGYVNIGGSSLFLIESKSLEITHPRKDGNIINIDLKGYVDLSVSTSGDYQKTYTHNGENYCHIIDSASGYPAKTGVASVTVIGRDGSVSEGISTALCLCEHNSITPTESKLASEIKRLTSNGHNAEFIFAVYDNGEAKQIITNAKEKQFNLLDKEYQIILL